MPFVIDIYHLDDGMGFEVHPAETFQPSTGNRNFEVEAVAKCDVDAFRAWWYERHYTIPPDDEVGNAIPDADHARFVVDDVVATELRLRWVGAPG